MTTETFLHAYPTEKASNEFIDRIVQVDSAHNLSPTMREFLGRCIGEWNRNEGKRTGETLHL